MAISILILGAGMVGTCTALHLQQRGHQVTLLDRREPGRETSYGNAGLIQREAVEPYPFPRDWASIINAALRRGADVHWHLNALPRVAPHLLRYFRNSAPQPYDRITQAYSRLIAHATAEHEPWIQAAQAQNLVQQQGFFKVYRTHRAWQAAARDAEALSTEYGIRHRVLDGTQLALAEPALYATLAGAIHWQDPWSVSDPGALVRRYATLFQQRGGQLIQGDATTLCRTGSAWSVHTEQGVVDAAQAVVALGPWSDALIRPLGYRYPLFIKRGYHRHYAAPTGLRHTLLDTEKGYVLAPMQQGVRLTTGAEFALLDAAPTPVQLARTEKLAQELVHLDQPVQAQPWLGARPCTADMLPIMGAAPQHPGLWFNFGHSHQGFTLGPVAGRLLADLIDGTPPFIDPNPYAPTRFGS